MSVANIPDPPKSASGWLDLLDKANRLNVIPIIVAGVVLYGYWKQGEKHDKQLEASEARTRAALAACASANAAESKKTREEVRKKARELRHVLQDGGTPASGDDVE